MRRSRFVATATTFALFLGSLAAAGPALSAAAAAPGPGAPPTSVSAAAGAVASTEDYTRPDLPSAQLAARLLNHRVEVTGLETETNTTWANPDGTLTSEESATPVRTQVAGKWAAIDTTLEAVAGGFAPKVSKLPVVFPSGGTAPLARTTRGADGVSLGWSGALPVPVVSGNTATYHDVSPGVDIVETAGTSGYEMSIVLTRRPSRPASFDIPVSVAGLAVSQSSDGGLSFTDAAGNVVFSSSAPMMWGASRDPRADEPTRVAAVDAKLTGAPGRRVLVVTPDPAFLLDPSVTYPVTIDPATTLAEHSFTYVSSASPTANYYDNNTTDLGVTGITKMGQYAPANTGANRAFYEFNTGNVLGVSVMSATLSVSEIWSSYCGAPTPVNLYDAALFTGPTSWNTQPATYNLWATASSRAGCSSTYPAARLNFDVTSLAQAWSKNGNINEAVVLRTDESNNNDWKKFDGNNAYVSVTYDAAPAAPGGRSTLPCDEYCGTGGAMVWTNSPEPTLYASAVDSDSSQVELQFELWAGTSSSPTTQLASVTTPYVASGAEVECVMPSTDCVNPSAYLADGASYEWRARAFDGTLWGPYSTWIQLTVDTTPPDIPSIWSSFASYTTASSGTMNWSDTSSDIGYYVYALDDNAPTQTTSTSATVSGVTSGQHDFAVAAVDKAGNATQNDYWFTVGPGVLTSPANQDRTQQSVYLTGAAPNNDGYVTYQYQLGSAGSAFQPIPLTLDSTGVSPVTVTSTGANVTSWPANSSTRLTWNMASTVGADGLVQVRACFSSDTAGSGMTCSPASNVQLTAHAFADSDATKPVGPGTVALLTGDYAVPSTDVNVPTYRGSLTLGRTFTTLAPTTSNGAAGVFGPGWRAAFYGPNAGHADATFVDNTAKGYVTLVDPDGTEEVYNYSGGKYVGQNDTAAQGSTITKNSATQYTLTEKDGTQTIYTETSGGVWGTSEVVEASNTPTATTTSYTLDAQGRVTQILAPIPAGISCATPTTTPGCRTLQFSYATTTTATGTTSGTFGDYAGQLASVSFTSYDPAAGAMASVQVAAYAYDSTGRLRQAWDPRISPALVTNYSYDANGRLATLTPPGLATTTFGYDSQGRITTVSHPDPSGAPATSTIAYNVPWNGAGPVNLASTVTTGWGESTDVPVTASAVFPADHVPAAAPSSSDWPYAQLTYMDVNGRPVNTASYGDGAWQVDAARYDAVGNNVWAISAGNLAQAITPTSATDPAVKAMTSESARADALATKNTYSSDGTELLSTLGPTHPVTTAAGSLIDGRAHVVNTYDEGAPGTGGPYRLLTTSVRGVERVNSATDYDTVTTHTGYAALVSGDVTGWVLRQPTSQTTVMSTGGNLTSYTRYNNAGQVIETRQPMGGNTGGTGTDAYTTRTTYYAATGTGSCVSAALAGLTCNVGPAAQPATGKPLPVMTTTYNMYDEPLVATETVGSVTRTTTTSYDAAGRNTGTQITVSPTGADGTDLPAQTLGYDAATGLPTTTSDTTGKTVTTSYDSVGRVHTYTDATGALTTTSYDIDGRVATVTDAKGSTTYTYDGVAGEHRGLLTSLTDSLAGTFSGSYDNDGNLTTQTYPGGLVATYSYDNSGEPTAVAYTKGSVTWLGFTAQRDAQGRIASANNAASVTTTYSYDNAGRLVTAVDNNGAGSCSKRTYGFNADSDRASLAASTFAATNGACTGSGTPTTVNHSYDQADRITDPGYTYDDFGRTLTVPSVDAGGQGDLTLGYYTNDLVQSISGVSDGQPVTKTYGLDPTGRVLTETTGAPPTVPGAPTDATATAGDGQAVISWAAPSSNGGAPITGYTVTASPGGLHATTTGATLAIVPGLTDGTAYTFTVTATNAAGNSASSAASAAVTPVAAPVSAPAHNATGAVTGSSLTTVSATAASAIPAGSTVFALLVLNGSTNASAYSFNDDAGNAWTVDGTDGGGSVGRAVLAQPISAGQHITAQWTGGSDFSAKLVIDTDVSALAPDGALPGLTNVSGSTHQITVAETAGDLMYGYDFSAPTQTSVTTSSPYTQLTQSLDSADGVITAYHLAAATGNATFKNVWSTSHVGDMAAAPFKSTGPGAVPLAPTGVSATAGNTQATVSWIAPTLTGGNPILGYVVTANPGGVTTSTTNSTSVTMTGLNGGTPYTFTVHAVTAAGAGTESAASASVTPTGTTTSTSLTDHYGDASDSPSWTAGSDGSWSRNVEGIDGNLDAEVNYAPGGGTSVVLQLLDMHGDVAGTATATGSGLSATYTYDEFGNLTSANGARYGWLGGKRRAESGVGGLVLMGVRLYDPASGRFLQTDPVLGGSANRYDYCGQDPVNCNDLLGTFPGSGLLKKAAHVLKSAWQHTRKWWKKHYRAAIMYTIGTVLIIGGIVLTGGAAAAVIAASDGILTAAAAEASEAATPTLARLALAKARAEIFQMAVHAATSYGAAGATLGTTGGMIVSKVHAQ